MANFNLYSRGDRIFGWANAILLGLFVLSTLYPFIYVLSVSLSSGAAVTAGRAELVRLHRAGRIDDETLHDLEHDLDLEELAAAAAKG